jgi:hypothetical protein
MSANVGVTTPRGDLGLRIIKPSGEIINVPRRSSFSRTSKGISFREVVRDGLPRPGLGREVNVWRLKNIPNLFRGLRRVVLARAFRLPTFYGALRLRVFRANGDVIDLGLASLRVVTTAGVNFIVDAFQNTKELENLKYHGIGTGTNAEASSDTALQTESTTALNPDNTRATGSLTEGASANIFRTVGTNAVDAAVANTEHGIFDQAATGGGTLLDRSVYSVVNLASADSLESTYDLTIPAGS